MSELQVGLLILGIVIVGAVLGLNWWQERQSRRFSNALGPAAIRRTLADPRFEGANSGHASGGTQAARPGPARRAQQASSERSPARRAEPSARTEAELSSNYPDESGLQANESNGTTNSSAASTNDDAIDSAPPTASSRRNQTKAQAAAEPVSATSRAQSNVSGGEPDLDEGTEGIIEVRFTTPVLGELLAPVVAGLRQAGVKPVRCLGLSTRAARHKTLQPNENYAGLRFGILLSNRAGPLTRVEFEEFLKRVTAQLHPFSPQVLADETPAVLQQAQQLDQVLAQLDRQVGITLVSRSEPWRINDIREAALQSGFQVSDDGRLIWLEPGLPVSSFALSHSDATPLYLREARLVPQITLLLDVPRVPFDPSPFSLMAQAARELAVLLDAEVVDDSGRSLSEEAEEKILEHLEWIYTRMEQAGLEPGSSRAARVFA